MKKHNEITVNFLNLVALFLLIIDHVRLLMPFPHTPALILIAAFALFQRKKHCKGNE